MARRLGSGENELTLFEAGPGSGEDRVRHVTLVRLAREIFDRLAGIGRIEVEGEVHGLKRYQSGVSFTLRERAARIPVWWSSNARGQGQCRVVDGQAARVVGSMRWDPTRGSVSLAAEEALPTGAGAVAELIAEARGRLAAAGLLDRPRRPLPRLPRAIGVVCGREAAVRRDIESVVAVRWTGYPTRFVEVGVSGPGAPEAIAGALRVLCADAEVDVIILARGGGDAADLLPWSDESLCAAIASSPVPVVSAIGHEEDRPLCDELADLRCGTPSLAANAVIPDRAGLRADLLESLQRVGVALDASTNRARARLIGLAPHRALDERAVAARHRLARGHDGLHHRHPRAATDRARVHLGALTRERDALSPARVLERGYAVVRRAGEPGALRDAGTVSAGQPVEITLASGALAAVVSGTSP